MYGAGLGLRVQIQALNKSSCPSGALHALHHSQGSHLLCSCLGGLAACVGLT